MSKPVQWPAIVQFTNSDELEIVIDQGDLNNVTLQPDIRLIGHNGALYELLQNENRSVNTTDTNSTVTVDEAVLIARKHMATQDQCCVSKFNARTVEEVIDALVASDDQ